MRRPRIISFDLDGTLVDKRYVDYLWEELIPKLYAEKYGLEFQDAKRRVRREYDLLGPHRIEWYLVDYWLKYFKLDKSKEELFDEIRHMIKPYSEVKHTLLELKRRGYRIIIATCAVRDFINLVMSQIPWLRELVSRVYSSTSDFKLTGKPKEFYVRITKIEGVKAKDIVHVGDDIEMDYIEPLKAGLKAYLIDRNDKYKHVKNRIRSLDELLHLI